jgi:hypothetical protein
MSAFGGKADIGLASLIHAVALPAKVTCSRLLRERLSRFRHHYGQPAEVRSAFEEAMGLK